MSLPSGRKLGPYEIHEQLGAGGMGEVYRATDTRLDRTVAVKILPAHLAGSLQLKQRLEREARAVSSLNHPHICSLFDIGHDQGIDYLVMEYVEGETLSDRLDRGPMEAGQALRIGTEIADALDRAHRSGIVHRDLKPGNIMLGKTGTKLLDFGLAKGMEASVPTALTASPTVASPLTAEGAIVGTFQYMAPEQLEGKEADARSDIFAFGAVFYEMMSGRRAFEGQTQASLIASILKEEPRPLSEMVPAGPGALDRVIRQCLAKDPDERWQSAGDLMRELRWISAGGSAAASAVATPGVRTDRRWLTWAIAAVLAPVLVAAGWFLRAPAPAEPMRSSLVLPVGSTLDNQNTSLALSPDGRRLVYAAAIPGQRQQLWVRPMDSLTAQPLSGTEGATYPFWSPDGAYIGFFADRKLKKIPSAGGTVQSICDAPDGRGASWSAGGVIVFAPEPYGGLQKVSASGGTSSTLTTTPETQHTHRNPHFLPDGERLLFFSGKNPGDPGNEIRSLDVATGESAPVVEEDSEGIYAEPGYLIFVRERNLMAQPIDGATLATTGEAVPIAERVSFNPYRWTGAYTVSGGGVLVYHGGDIQAESTLTKFDLDGNVAGTFGEATILGGVGGALSPDGRRAVIPVRDRSGQLDLWMYDLDRGVRTRFTFGPGAAAFPVWSPDGSRIAFSDGAGGIYLKGADGASERSALLTPSETIYITSDWAPDGSTLVLYAQSVNSDWNVSTLRLAEGAEPSTLIGSAANESGGKISPDGRWIGWISDESGRGELFVAPYPGLGGKWQISSEGATDYFWLGDGRRIAYQSLDGKLLAVDLSARGGNLDIGDTKPLFGGEAVPQGGFLLPSPDGASLLAAVPLMGDKAPELTLVTGWPSELARP